jgi:D-3-phosphoglycerate dehydrogenase / 2-oxoglutarate reductase
LPFARWIYASFAASAPVKTVLVTEPIHADGLARLEAGGVRVIHGKGLTGNALAAAIAEADALAVRTFAVSADVLARANKLSVVAKHGVGCDNIDVARCSARGIPVLITAQANKVSVAEQTLMFMLALAKDVTWYDRAVRTGDWSQRTSLRAIDLAGRTLLVVGFGRIGKEVAARARAFGMRVIVADIELDFNMAVQLGCETTADFREHLAEADVLTLHVPKTPATTNMIGKPELAKIKRGAILINCARGGLVDEDALAASLKDGTLAAAGLDVFNLEPASPAHPLLKLPNALVSPHSAASTLEGGRRMSIDTAENILAAFAGRVDPDNVFNPGYDMRA